MNANANQYTNDRYGRKDDKFGVCEMLAAALTCVAENSHFSK